jgi:hypothetical protein
VRGKRGCMYLVSAVGPTVPVPVVRYLAPQAKKRDKKRAFDLEPHQVDKTTSAKYKWYKNRAKTICSPGTVLIHCVNTRSDPRTT